MARIFDLPQEGSVMIFSNDKLVGTVKRIIKTDSNL